MRGRGEGSLLVDAVEFTGAAGRREEEEEVVVVRAGG